MSLLCLGLLPVIVYACYLDGRNVRLVSCFSAELLLFLNMCTLLCIFLRSVFSLYVYQVDKGRENRSEKRFILKINLLLVQFCSNRILLFEK